MEKGNVFQIQKFCVHDGPGIRTTVFLKGCPLRCKWCANPESQQGDLQVLWDASLCVGCGSCIAVCPVSCLVKEQERVVLKKGCTGCGLCQKACPNSALQLEGKVTSVEEVLEVCLQDLPFYEESGGGVTLSGGETLAQPGFTKALLKALKKEGIHTALETTGFAPAQVFLDCIANADLLLFDMKHWNEEKHKEGTGVSNQEILQNMKKAVEMGKQVLPRIPVIPGYNDSLEDAAGFSALLLEIGCREAQLLPFHQFGEKKYTLLDKPYAYAGQKGLTQEALEPFRKVFLEKEIHCFF